MVRPPWIPKKHSFKPVLPSVAIPPSVATTKISVIVTGRNDNYDGNFNERLTIALTKNIASFPEAEFIFVEWNPHLDRSLVCEYLKRIFGERVRYYVVHPKFHTTFCLIDEFIEYPAKNVGIRRAKNEYVLCTNSDVIFSPEVVTAMKGNLKGDVLYRAVRVDVPMGYTDIQFPLPEDKRLSTHTQGLCTNGAGDFLLMHKDLWNKATGYCEDYPAQRLHKDAFIIHMLMKQGYTFESLGEITHWRHPSSWANGYIRPRVGDVNWKFQDLSWKGNRDTWGFVGANEIDRGGIIWIT